jgi:hypothetical protein
MAKYTIYLDCPLSYGIVKITHLCLRDNLDTSFIDNKYYLLYKDVLEQEIEHHILRLTDLGYKVLQVIPNKDV